MDRIPETFSSSVVALGAFNPAIFTPDWLESKNLIGAGDAEGARLSEALLVSRQVSVVDTEWFVLQVLEEQLTLTSKGVLAPSFKDLAQGIFTLLSQTPVVAIGINFIGEYKMPNEKDYHKIGDVLAPKNVWHTIFSPSDFAVGLNSLSIRVQNGTREQNALSKDQRNITVRPSTSIKSGVFFQVNNHFSVEERADKLLSSAEVTAKLLDENWLPAWEDAKNIFSTVLDRALAVDTPGG